MTAIDKQALRERYSPKPVPECHICGEEMTIQRISASRITYGCTGATYDDKGCHYAEGRSIADDHYEQSRVTVVDVSDPDVLALLDELEHYKSREERVTKLVLDNSTSWDVLYEKLEAAEKRIAEQREYYEGVIADGSKRIAELEKGHQEAAKQINSWRRLAKQNIAERGKDISELESARQRIAELERSETQLISERDDAESALNDAYKAVMGQAPEWSNWFSFENAIDEIELACELWRNQTDDVIQFRQRIAELEAKLETADKLQDSAFRDGLKAGFSYGQTDDQSGFAQCMSAYSTRAGIGVKQQEDSVDSDVGRNQPGMVVAVHIGAGDFVKVKGQVFEVEETDFDDHDVTLWFVGGNALKCEAGCPVEVVSAPVAAGIKVKGE
ncbi:protein Ead [Salmonella enterica]|nr:protein Ead [Salmonella enterica]EDN2102008.1 protein Ead [Salmonella enterica]EDO3722618.1 protein Ead [Salmonella enterica]EEA1748318.1 protein Ead [Salmonella enterica]ELG0802089.1 ead/Ea22-like family protein [Salmonella enterica]